MTITPAAPAIDVIGAVQLLSRHAENASAFLALNDETRHFTAPGIDGLVAYRPAGRRWLVQLGGPFAARAEQPALLAAFEAWAAGQRRRVLAVQLLRHDAELYAGSGYVVNQLGSSYSISLEGYSLRGRKMVKVRNMVNRAHREGITVAEVPYAQRAAVTGALDAIDAAWLGAKGRHTKELAFMIGERDGRGAPYRRLFVAQYDGRPVGYVSCAPVYGVESGWLYDLTRRAPDAPPGVIEAVFAHAVEVFQAEGAGWLHLGLTPSPAWTRASRCPARTGGW
ncbi:DUF2156 domain-containing protein [Phytohabitans rumicis]|uniref:Phosphatidylglycerol lysyltransferase C-terminal domain-containing protein n=1 Tax=Phytohabitans rumicis TaxID=1076125 RepID=A0A6V8LAP3_9ACTN|nr:DUF2156 domain-containing protein [Phytohabitans rumicis]GFJ91609.1 hypothetical protein Prum_052510 [Phytohabitans rumicis]